MVDRIQRRNTHMRISPMFLYNVCVCVYIFVNTLLKDLSTGERM